MNYFGKPEERIEALIPTKDRTERLSGGGGIGSGPLVTRQVRRALLLTPRTSQWMSAEDLRSLAAHLNETADQIDGIQKDVERCPKCGRPAGVFGIGTYICPACSPNNEAGT
jgi:hypothetical protein